jgi:hypothetical protein
LDQRAVLRARQHAARARRPCLRRWTRA